MKLMFGAACIMAGALSSGAAFAGTYVVEETQSPFIACYNRVYVPAKVLVNTKGKLVQAPSKTWVIAGDSWNYVRNPAVYIETKRVIDPDHYTLVGTVCK